MIVLEAFSTPVQYKISRTKAHRILPLSTGSCLLETLYFRVCPALERNTMRSDGDGSGVICDPVGKSAVLKAVRKSSRWA